MKFSMLGKFTAVALLFLATLAVLITIALFSNDGDFSTSALVISGIVCTMIGIFSFMFASDEPVDLRLIGILHAQELLNLCSLAHHLGIHGGAHFLPPRITGEIRVMQFNPTSTYKGEKGSTEGSFRETGPPGLVTPPSCDLLIEYLKKRNDMIIPNEEEELTWVLHEIFEDACKFAGRISVKWEDRRVTITFHRYRFYDGCKIIAQKSPQCCTTSPCPACSLCGALIAESRDRVVRLDQCSMNISSKDVTAVFSILPLVDSNP
jgi:hypothetical protein